MTLPPTRTETGAWGRMVCSWLPPPPAQPRARRARKGGSVRTA